MDEKFTPKEFTPLEMKVLVAVLGICACCAAAGFSGNPEMLLGLWVVWLIVKEIED